MQSVWIDSPIPVEFHGPSLNLQNIGKIGYFGNVIQSLSPLIIVAISLGCVLMSFYAAPSTLTIKESPVLYPPKYFLIVGHSTESGKSFFDSNFPFLTNGPFYPLYRGTRVLAAVTPTKYLNVTVLIPPIDLSIYHLNVLLPTEIGCPKLGKGLTHTIVQFQVGSSTPLNRVDALGRLIITQKKVLSPTEADQNDGIDLFLEEVAPVSGWTIEGIMKRFGEMPISLKSVIVSQTVENRINQKGIELRLTFRVPDVFIQMEAPFWNMFKVTYVQLFYWFTLIYFVWYIIVRTGFKYGVIESSVWCPLRATKPHAD
jgi:hypothetical protein